MHGAERVAGGGGPRRHAARASIDYGAQMARRQEQEPARSEVVEVAPGVLRMELPLALPGLGHVNCYALLDRRGAAVVDPGLPGPGTWRAIQDRLRRAGLATRHVHSVIVTHSHPDHVGLAGWITERFYCPLQMSQVEYLQSVYHQNRGTEERRNAQRLFFRRHPDFHRIRRAGLLSIAGSAAVFYFFPCDPPRKLDHMVDTIREGGLDLPSVPAASGSASAPVSTNAGM